MNSGKAYGYDGISITMLKIFGPSMVTSFSLLFSNCLRDFFLTIERKQMSLHCLKLEGNKQLASNKE